MNEMAKFGCKPVAKFGNSSGIRGYYSAEHSQGVAVSMSVDPDHSLDRWLGLIRTQQNYRAWKFEGKAEQAASEAQG
jgi:hypothetical protein